MNEKTPSLSAELRTSLEKFKEELQDIVGWLDPSDVKNCMKVIELVETNLTYLMYKISEKTLKNIQIWVQEVEEPINDFIIMGEMKRLEAQDAA